MSPQLRAARPGSSASRDHPPRGRPHGGPWTVAFLRDHQDPAAAPTLHSGQSLGCSLHSLSPPCQLPPPTPGYVWIGRVGPWPTAPGSWNPSQEHSQLSQLHLGATNKHCCLETPPRPSIPGLNHGTRATKSSLATIICPTLSFLRQED